MSCIVIAEAGVNHNGELANALALVDAAAAAGADYVKFQTFKTENIVTKTAKKAEYQERNLRTGGTQFEMLKRLELGEEHHFRIQEHCKKKGIHFLSTPFDTASLKFLVESKLIDRVKVPSGEITNLPFLLDIARTGLPIILSSGMSTLSEVEMALATIAFGLTTPNGNPANLDALWEALWSRAGHEAISKTVTLLHCTTEYPALPETINLRAMDTLKAAFSLPVGFSDHSQGIHIPVAAVARGACLIEKHFTLSRSMEGPDHKASLEPEELRRMIAEIREVEQALGTGRKEPGDAERANRRVARKALVASRNIAIGDVFAPENLAILRSQDGLAPSNYWSLLGVRANRSYAEGDPILVAGY